jgi:hypothetical protein
VGRGDEARYGLAPGLERFARAAGAVEPGDVAAARDAVIASCIGLREDDLCLLVLTRTGA